MTVTFHEVYGLVLFGGAAGILAYLAGRHERGERAILIAAAALPIVTIVVSYTVGTLLGLSAYP